MTPRSVLIDSWLQTAVLVCICIIIFTGPASIFGMGNIYDDDLFGEISGYETMIWTGSVWMFVIPLVLARKWWNTNPARSALALGTFLIMTLLIRLTLGNFAVLLLGMALFAPFAFWAGSERLLETIYYIARLLAFIVGIVIPMAAMVFQISRRGSQGTPC